MHCHDLHVRVLRPVLHIFHIHVQLHVRVPVEEEGKGGQCFLLDCYQYLILCLFFFYHNRGLDNSVTRGGRGGHCQGSTTGNDLQLQVL